MHWPVRKSAWGVLIAILPTLHLVSLRQFLKAAAREVSPSASWLLVLGVFLRCPHTRLHFLARSILPLLDAYLVHAPAFVSRASRVCPPDTNSARSPEPMSLFAASNHLYFLFIW